ncbi:MAG TPA: OmpA family protein [Polyangiaceae bacterium]|jgi:outer membrane protein OmpA-like peptidoglycan-associated protein|nr:OmpA family protein [Polyangiaceae bacterium]
MNLTRVFVLGGPVCIAALVACGGERMPPKTLVDAQNELARAKGGVAMQLDPTDVHEAELALQKAERAWSDDPDEPNTMDLAIIAQRKAQIAEAEATAMKGAQDATGAKREQDALMASQLQATRGALDKTSQKLQAEQADAAANRAKLADLETKLKDARDTITKIAAVKDDDRGMVITLQGEVLFKTGKWDLKAGAMAKLDQIAEALRGKEQPIVVFGYTDNVGTRDNNMDLSQKRAAAVRDYIVGRGIPSDLVTAQGKGPDDPVSDNGSVDGRAANRRVELVVKPKSG